MAIREQDRKHYLERALKAADWFVNSQIKCEKVWMSDHGRFLYYYFMPEKKHVPGINWSHGRALFILTEAYKITGDKRYLDSMELGIRYMRALQPLDPAYVVSHGAIREEIPQSERGGILDGAQAASGLLMLYRVTKNPEYLRRGRAFCDFLVRTFRPESGFANMIYFDPERVTYMEPFVNCCHHASAIPLWHLYKITGEWKYTEPIVATANQILRYQRADGGILYTYDTKSVKEVPFNHHWGLGEGEERFLLRNDDGIVTVMLAAYRITHDKRFLDSMVKYAKWIMKNEPHVRPFNAFGIQAANVLDVGKAAGEDYSDWVLKNLDKHCLQLQVSGSGDSRAEGGFRGEDEEGNSGIFGGEALDYVPTRNTCYMAGVLFRLSGKGYGSGFSVYGLGEEDLEPVIVPSWGM